MSNTHTQIAQLRAAGVHEWQSGEGSTDATNIAAALDAQVEATLALAYEQRTANLIALAELKRKDRSTGPTAESTELIMIVEERLDLP